MRNAYDLLADLRDNVGEATAAHWADDELLRKLNANQRMASMELALQVGDWLLTSSSVTPSSSVITLPSDCLKPVYLEETSTGRRIFIQGNVRDRRVTRQASTSMPDYDLDAYFLGLTQLEVNKESYVEACTLWYYKRIADMFTGTADTGSTTNTIVFIAANGPRVANDYYNGLYLEAVAGTGIGTKAAITDYVGSTRTATVAGTFSTDTEFGTILELPEEGWPLIVVQSTLDCLAKPSSSVDEKIFAYWSSRAKRAQALWTEYIADRSPGNQMVRVTELD